MASKRIYAVFATLLVAFCLFGCNKEENSPDMGAVAPKPKADMMNKLPPEVREKMSGTPADVKAQANAVKPPVSGK